MGLAHLFPLRLVNNRSRFAVRQESFDDFVVPHKAVEGRVGIADILGDDREDVAVFPGCGHGVCAVQSDGEVEQE